MTKDELITKQQLEIEDYKALLQENTKIHKTLHSRFYSLGQPLNDNILKMDKKQLSWCFELSELVQQLNSI